MLLLLPCVKFEISNQPICWHLLSLCAAAFDLNMSHFQPVSCSFQICESNEGELFWAGSTVARSKDIRVWKPHGGICTGKEGSGERKSGFHWNQILWMLQAILLSLKLEVMNKRTSFANIHITIDAKFAKFDKLIDARRRSMQAFKSDLASSKMRKLKSLQAPNWQVTSMTIWHDVWPEKMMT